MKKLVLPLLFICSLSYGQKESLILPIDSITNKITYSGVVKIDSVNKQELYSRAREWFAKAYKNSSKVIQMEDKESGKIVGKAMIEVYGSTLGIRNEGGNINYTISIYIKEGRYKYEVTDFYHTGFVSHSQYGTAYIPDGGPCEKLYKEKKGIPMINTYKNTYEKYLNEMDITTKILIEDLKQSMESKSKNTKSDNW